MGASGWHLVACCMLSGIVSGLLVWVIAWNSDIVRRHVLEDRSREVSMAPRPRSRRKYTESR